MVPYAFMEKRKPSFDLEAFKAVGGDPRRLVMTTTAYRSAQVLGFDRPLVTGVIRSMQRAHFYKSMTGYRDYRRWHDVYHVPWKGMTLYVKFTDDVVSEFTILSFKER
ncbi:MAG TPA: type II toxin-antitoxin system MqsR family toxin [Rhizomicrobium sp.]